MRDEVVADVAEWLAESSTAGASATTAQRFFTCNSILAAVSTAFCLPPAVLLSQPLWLFTN